LLLFDANGILSDPDGNYVAIKSSDEGLGSPIMARQSEGMYRAEYVCPATESHGVVRFDFTWAVGGKPLADHFTSSINQGTHE
jgi:hypothetical protein